MIDELIDIIGREATLFESFLALLEQQRDALAGNDLQRLNDVTSQLRERLVESQLLNQKRELVIHRIKVANAIDGDLSVTRLLELVDETQAGQLRQLRQTILGLHDKIAERRNVNAMVLNRSREYIVKMMEMLSRVASPQSTYDGRPGPVKTGSAALAVDRRA